MMLEATSISERRACALVGLSRNSWRHPRQHAQHEQAASQRIGSLLRSAGTMINDQRVYRLYELADLSERKRRGRQHT